MLVVRPASRLKGPMRLPALREGEGLETVGWPVTDAVFQRRTGESDPKVMRSRLQHTKALELIGNENDSVLAENHPNGHEDEGHLLAGSRRHKHTVKICNCRPESRTFLRVLPPPFAQSLAILATPLRAHLALDQLHELGPVLATRVLVAVEKIDHVSMMLEVRAFVDFLAADVRKDHFRSSPAVRQPVAASQPAGSRHP